MSTPREAISSCGLNLAGQAVGFLQPIFTVAEGDNQSYVQRLDTYEVVAGFDAVEHPERGLISFAEPASVQAGGEALWAFCFPDEPPLVAPFRQFRALLAGRLEDPALLAHPLLRFDIVETLNLDAHKAAAYELAFNAYAQMSEGGAEHWRNRAIIEPALIKTAQDIGYVWKVPEAIRVTNLDNLFQILVPEDADAVLREEFKGTLSNLAARFPSLFPDRLGIDVRGMARVTAPSFRRSRDVTVILVGKLAQRQLPLPITLPGNLNVHLVYAEEEKDGWIFEHFEPSQLTLVLAVARQWRQLAHVGLALAEHKPVLVTIGSSNEALLSDFEIQTAVGDIATIGLFAPAYAGATGDPIGAIRPLIEMFVANGALVPGSSAMEHMPSRHCAMVRHTMLDRPDLQEIACLLAARALRAGAIPGARGNIVIDIDARDPAPPGVDFSALFDVRQSPGSVVPAGGRRQMALLIARDERRMALHRSAMAEGVGRLLAMRGWDVGVRDSHLELSAADRRFAASVVEGSDDIPADDESNQAPALGRASVLVIHVHPRRDALLDGNCGKHLHIGMNDIALMRPGTEWIWPVLKRQLFGAGRRESPAALRLLAALCSEAFRYGRFQVIGESPPLDLIEAMLQSRDVERYIAFMPDGLTAREALLHIRSPMGEPGLMSGQDAVLRIRIEREGPLLIIG